MFSHHNNIIIGIQVDIKPPFKDASVQCALLAPVTTSTPIKLDKAHFLSSESELSEVDELPAADLSTSVYCPSKESSQS